MDELEAADNRLQKYRKIPNQRIGEIRDAERSGRIDNDVRINQQLAEFLVKANTEYDLKPYAVTGRKKGTNGRVIRRSRYEAILNAKETQ